ncbi:MAG: tetratricopeptide repeat protein [Calditrichia bacterium]|nr:tetratricopeptide repeat protein [Calditrichia bacterium]
MKNIYNISIWIVLFLVSAMVLPGKAEMDRSKVMKGIKSFEKEQWDESLQHFQDALLDDPEHPVGHYNVGESLYKKKNYEEALKSYEKALSTPEIAMREKIYYNLGNTYYQLNKYQEAIQSYIKALDLDPDDQDAKHNLELVRAKLKEMAQKQPMENQQQQQQQSGDQQQSQQQQQGNGQEQQEQQENQDQQQQAQKDDDKQENEQKSAKPQEKQKELTKEEAERILQALKSEERENQKLRQVQRPARIAPVEKDW